MHTNIQINTAVQMMVPSIPQNNSHTIDHDRPRHELTESRLPTPLTVEGTVLRSLPPDGSTDDRPSDPATASGSVSATNSSISVDILKTATPPFSWMIFVAMDASETCIYYIYIYRDVSMCIPRIAILMGQ